MVQSAEAVEYSDCISSDPPPKECPGYDTKQFDGEPSVILKLWGMRSTHSMTSLPGLRWIVVVVADWVLSMGQIELFDI